MIILDKLSKFKEISFPKYLKYLRFRKNNKLLFGTGTKVDIHDTASMSINGVIQIGISRSALCNNLTSFTLRKNSRFTAGESVIIGRGTNIVVNDHACLAIGDHTYIAGDTKIYCRQDIKIGSDCAIAWGITIIDSDFHSLVGINPPHEMTKPISIGDHVWIGANCTILKGVSIGANAVVAAGSVITKDVAAGTIVGGNPARVIRSDIQWR